MHNRLLLELFVSFMSVIGLTGNADITPLPGYVNNIACNVTVDAGPDQSLCLSGEVQLDGTADGEVLWTLWSPPIGLSNPEILDPTADITNTITYTLTAWGIDPDNPNIITNGDFENGNVGFDSDYNYVQDMPGTQEEMVPAGTYTIINNPFLVHEAWAPCEDHTPGSGDQLMLINGELALQNFWCQTVDVIPGTYYNVEAWVSSVHPTSPAVLQFSINGNPIGPIITAPSELCEWIPFNAVWNAGAETTAEICIINLNTTEFGNDFALDDITMVALCEVSDEVTIFIEEEPAPVPDISGPELLCAEEIASYTATLPALPLITSYQWVVTGGTILGGQGTNEISVQWNNNVGSGSLCLMIETECDENENCFEVILNELPAEPLINGPLALCPGEAGTFSINQSDPQNEFIWIVPPQVSIISGEGTNEVIVVSDVSGEVDICVEVNSPCGTADNCTTLLVHEIYQTSFDTSLCEGATIIINGTVYGNGNFFGTEDFISSNGCDSIVEITITEVQSLEFMQEISLCPGDSIFLEGAFQFEEGLYVDTFVTASGCDSILISELNLEPLDTTWISTMTCDPTQAGVFISTISTPNCDSTVITEVLLSEIDTTIISLTSCMVEDTGQVITVFTNQEGCDSTVITNTFFQQSDTTLLFATSCDPEDVGIVTDQLTNVNGCDSLVITTTSFTLSDTTQIFDISCDPGDVGVVINEFTNIEGCDSLVITTTLFSPSDTTRLFETSCNSDDVGVVTNELMNINGCDSLVITTTSFSLSDTTIINLFTCTVDDTMTVANLLTNMEGCDSLVIEVTDYVGSDTTFLTDNSCISADTGWVHIQLMNSFGCDSILSTYTAFVLSDTTYVNGASCLPQDTGIVIQDLIDQSGCDSVVVISTFLLPPLQIDVVLDSLYNGFGVPCAGDMKGHAHVEILSGGSAPYVFEWSNGSISEVITDLAAGVYRVSVTDVNNCFNEDSIEISGPPQLNLELTTTDISCYGLTDGEVMVSQIEGGVMPWTTSLNGSPFYDSLIYQMLPSGSYTLIVRDANGCSVEETFNLVEPPQWSIELGEDTTVLYGISVEIHSTIIGSPAGEIEYRWSDDKCLDCPSRWVEILSDTTLILSVVDQNGCESEDEIQFQLIIPELVFIPNVFTPNGDQVNDYFFVSTNPFIENIDELSIFDRWGNMVFQKFDFPPNDQMLGWDGRFKEQLMNPAVFAYKVIVSFNDGTTKAFYGDVTLVR